MKLFALLYLTALFSLITAGTVSLKVYEVRKQRADQLHSLSLQLRGLGESCRIPQQRWEGNIGSGAVPSFAQLQATLADLRSFVDRYEASENASRDEAYFLRDLLRVCLHDPRIQKGSDATALRDGEDKVCDESMNRRYQR